MPLLGLVIFMEWVKGIDSSVGVQAETVVNVCEQLVPGWYFQVDVHVCDLHVHVLDPDSVFGEMAMIGYVVCVVDVLKLGVELLLLRNEGVRQASAIFIEVILFTLNLTYIEFCPIF